MDVHMEVVIVGGIVTDRVSYYREIPSLGDKSVQPNHVKIQCGGKGANMSVMCSKLGARTALISKIGEDDYGKMHLRGLHEYGVNTEYVEASPGVSTDMVDIAVAEDGQNRIDEVSRACMYLIQPGDIERCEAMIKQAAVIGGILEPYVETTVASLRLGRKYGLITLFNAAPLLDCSSVTDDVFHLTDVFFCNEFEAGTITGRPCHSVEEAKSVCRCLLERGCSVAIITLGHQGCVYGRVQGGEAKHLPAREVQAVDSTGASDAFFGALCFYFARFCHLDLEEKIRRSMEIATISVLNEGTQASYPYASDLSEKLLN
ncbi:ribokinase-like [Lineus longissimus]|uniref:ribokinase-like n=1 Tax=Lineus longissimus TaxID=88925 RepID=UPI002B4D8613